MFQQTVITVLAAAEGGHAAAANIPEKARLVAFEFVYAMQRLED